MWERNIAREFYDLVWTGKRLERNISENSTITFGDTGIPTTPWRVHSCLGDDNKVWCEVYRSPQHCGGIFVMRDFDEVLFMAHAQNNMAFVQALSEFAQIVSHPRYASDIFENADDDVFGE